MKILKTPWKDELMEMVSGARHSIKIMAPFVKASICETLLHHKSAKAKLELITSFKLSSMYAGSLDLKALEQLISHKAMVKNYPPLHAKVYLFDEQKAVITSGNLTNGGLLRNYEYGIYTTDKTLVQEVSHDFSTLSAHEYTSTVKQQDIATMQRILAKLPAPVPGTTPAPIEDIPSVVPLTEQAVSSSLSGWKRAVFTCVYNIPTRQFSLSDLQPYVPQLQQRFPANTHVMAKIRQQLQYLRDLGLIEFLGNGRYQKLWG